MAIKSQANNLQAKNIVANSCGPNKSIVFGWSTREIH